MSYKPDTAFRTAFELGDDESHTSHMPNSMPTAATGVIAHFYHMPMIDGAASVKAGRAIYKNEEMVRLTIAGDVHQTTIQRVRDHHKRRWKDEYAYFREGNKDVFVKGSPLSEWPLINTAQVANLRHVNVHSVEQLAEMDDNLVMGLGIDGSMLRQRAIDWLRAADSAAGGLEMAARAREMEERSAHQDETIAKLQAKLEQTNALLQMTMRNAGKNAPTDDQLAAAAEMGLPGSPERVNPGLMAEMLEAQGLDPAIAPTAPPPQALPDLPQEQPPGGLTLPVNPVALEPAE